MLQVSTFILLFWHHTVHGDYLVGKYYMHVLCISITPELCSIIGFKFCCIQSSHQTSQDEGWRPCQKARLAFLASSLRHLNLEVFKLPDWDVRCSDIIYKTRQRNWNYMYDTFLTLQKIKTLRQLCKTSRQNHETSRRTVRNILHCTSLSTAVAAVHFATIPQNLC